MIPPSYKPARWRCTIPVDHDTGDLAIAFDVGSEIVRLRTSIEDAIALKETLHAVIAGRHPMTGSLEPGSVMDVSGDDVVAFTAESIASFAAAREVPVPD